MPAAKGDAVETLKVGIVGAGGIAEQHGVAWRANAPRGEIVAVADVAEARARSFAGRYTGPGAELHGGIESLLADPNVDAVDICLPHHLHAPAIVAAARAGKAILCEKPLCTSLEDAAAINAAVQETGVTFMMAHNQLFQPSLIEARRLLAAGAIGRPFLYRSVEAFQNRAALAPVAPAGMAEGESPWAWRSDPKRMGGGEVLDTGWHATYRLLALAGDDRPVAVQAMTERYFLPDWPAEDTGLLLVRFASGAIGEILTTWAFATVGAQQFEAMGEHGSLAGSGARILHQLHRWPQPAERVDDPVHSFTAEVTHFLDVVQRGATSLAPVATGTRVLQLTLAAYLAAAEGRQVELPENPLEAGA
ncbi:MAG: hypothetical protein AVDCRST_MAG19-3591 [uncultured Thermomicrobiales bacterium]|uniref:Gfo/Idh/MocA family oxidoreductase n=1 Tax=uncultured Thermomicrobiales bacterium TaxID=1645740 RepID=A0A6J4VHF2_9BACT|nr:MAG: hypothetical protein AVDCRST_MAG19-3591 [uncultured Thermomicrobiales bacterium]